MCKNSFLFWQVYAAELMAQVAGVVMQLIGTGICFPDCKPEFSQFVGDALQISARTNINYLKLYATLSGI